MLCLTGAGEALYGEAIDHALGATEFRADRRIACEQRITASDRVPRGFDCVRRAVGAELDHRVGFAFRMHRLRRSFADSVCDGDVARRRSIEFRWQRRRDWSRGGLDQCFGRLGNIFRRERIMRA